MYQFTKQTILSTLQDVDGLARFTGTAATKTLSLPYFGNFKAGNVENNAVYKNAYSAPSMATATFSVSAALAKAKVLNPDFTQGVFRINLFIRVLGENSSLYANDFVFKGRPVYIEAECTTDDTASTLADKLINNAVKYGLTVNQDPMVTITKTTSVDTTPIISLVVTGNSEYQAFTQASLEYYNEKTGMIVGGYTQGDWQVANAGTVVANKEGMGTYQYMIKNISLPTSANTNWTSVNLDQRPIMGGKYSQYVIKYCVNRGIMGTSAVGVPVKSITNHVIWVESGIVTAFETAVTTATLTLVDASAGVTGKPELENDTAVDLENDVNPKA